MIEGLKLITIRFMQLMCLPFLKIVFNNVDAYVHTQNLTAMPGLAAPLSQIESGVDIIWFVGFAGVSIAALQMYYRAVRQRKYEGEYSESGWAAKMYE